MSKYIIDIPDEDYGFLEKNGAIIRNRDRVFIDLPIEDFEPYHDPDPVKIGDEVTAKDGDDTVRFVITCLNNNRFYGINEKGTWCCFSNVTKTGNHFNHIEELFKEMRGHS